MSSTLTPDEFQAIVAGILRGIAERQAREKAYIAAQLAVIPLRRGYVEVVHDLEIQPDAGMRRASP